jgi:hypothetical protein
VTHLRLLFLGISCGLLVLAAHGCGSSNDNGTDGGNSPDAGGASPDGGPQDSGNGNTTDAGPLYTIGGTVFGSGGMQNGLTLTTAGEPNLVTPGSTWAFANAVPSGTSYNVAISAQPSNGTVMCSITDGGVGVVGSSNVTDIQIGCAIQLP